MPKSKLYIHIGTWKTGSSTLQYNLNKNRPQLEKEGFVYLSKENKMVVDDGIIRNIREPDVDYIKQSRKKLHNIRDAKQKINPEFHFISSSEEFSGDPFDGFKNAGAVAETLYEITKDSGLEVVIIVYLRRQDNFMESMYTQSIHMGSSHSFDEFIKPFDSDSFNWENLLRSYSGFFGKNVIVRRYDKHYLPENDSLVQDFGRVIGSSWLSRYSHTVSRNRGVSRDALEIIRITNENLDEESQYRLRNIFQAVNSKKPFEKYSYMDSDIRKQILARYDKTNAAVAKKYLGDESGILFPPPDFTYTNKIYPGLSKEAIVVNFSRGLLAVEQRVLNQKKEIRKEFRNKFFRTKLRDKISSLLNRTPGVKSALRKLSGAR